MNMVPVVSDTVAFVGYDPATHTLRVKFRSGGIYDYYDVPVFLYEAMLLPHPWRRVGRQPGVTATVASQPESTTDRSGGCVNLGGMTQRS